MRVSIRFPDGLTVQFEATPDPTVEPASPIILKADLESWVGDRVKVLLESVGFFVIYPHEEMANGHRRQEIYGELQNCFKANGYTIPQGQGGQ
jgi:hypothetical protein